LEHVLAWAYRGLPSAFRPRGDRSRHGGWILPAIETRPKLGGRDAGGLARNLVSKLATIWPRDRPSSRRQRRLAEPPRGARGAFSGRRGRPGPAQVTDRVTAGVTRVTAYRGDSGVPDLDRCVGDEPAQLRPADPRQRAQDARITTLMSRRQTSAVALYRSAARATRCDDVCHVVAATAPALATPVHRKYQHRTARQARTPR
jgi:hypothetical protein